MMNGNVMVEGAVYLCTPNKGNPVPLIYTDNEEDAYYESSKFSQDNFCRFKYMSHLIELQGAVVAFDKDDVFAGVFSSEDAALKYFTKLHRDGAKVIYESETYKKVVEFVGDSDPDIKLVKTLLTVTYTNAAMLQSVGNVRLQCLELSDL